MKWGLVLEGGGMRCAYTVGVLDALMEGAAWADYVVGVSAGASNGASYVSRQPGRGLRVNLDYLKDPRYVGLASWRKTGSVFGMDFIFGVIPQELDPFDFEAFWASPCQFRAGVTDVETGQAVYFTQADVDRDLTVLRASSSLPVFSPMVTFRGRQYLDGGAADPIPVAQALQDGCDRLVVVLTRPRGYVKGPEGGRAVYRRAFRDYPAMIEVLDRRHEVYRRAQQQAYGLEQSGRAIVLQPQTPLKISRFEKRRDRLLTAYRLGLADGRQALPRIRTWMEGLA